MGSSIIIASMWNATMLLNLLHGPNAQVQVAIMVHDPTKAACHEHVLLAELLHSGPLGKLQRLRPAVRQVRRRVNERLALVRTVPQREDIFPPVAILARDENASDLAFEGSKLPLEW
eukprot:CAMPEP_0179277284 /NCGR_PEP_ID=MMETSP0797-20121207/35016_1 /TAXON_ID=47934 /ORGANISM="Dinophysis acuminata, Strain DAEP01" /LENGTH=116 /DNA_ID=CAMNT_0020985871 /DNA_START=229 /DNA_END=579 /DNA_ORIENTATION=-